MGPCSVNDLRELTVMKTSKVKTLACRPIVAVRGGRSRGSLSRVTLRYRGVLDARAYSGLSFLFSGKNSSNKTEPGVLAGMSKRS